MPDRPLTDRLAGSGLLADPNLRRALGVLNPGGEETRVVGGAVRNALLGLAPGDIDLATTMRPEAVMERAHAARLRAIPTGIEHGTVTLIVGGLPIEVTTLREDVETDGRHAVVRFGRDFVLDAQRRDFTMNALSAAADGEVYDTVGGADDLAAGRVRFIGDAATRIREDYLRILRFFRFHAVYGRGPLDPPGLEAAEQNRTGLDRLSRERVRAELFKILGAPGARRAVDTMAATGILDHVVGTGADARRFGTLLELDPDAPDPLLGLAALAIRDQPAAERSRDMLRLTNAETTRLKAALAAGTGLEALPGEAALRRLLFAQGAQPAADGLRLAYAAGLPPRDAKAWRDALGRLAAWPRPVLPLTGADLLARGIQGPALGAALARLRSDWAAAGFPEDPGVLEAMLDRVCGARDQPA